MPSFGAVWVTAWLGDRLLLIRLLAPDELVYRGTEQLCVLRPFGGLLRLFPNDIVNLGVIRFCCDLNGE